MANPLWARAEELRRARAPLLDLTETNPTRCGLRWPADELAALLAGPALAAYDPDPRGLRGAREAVAAYLAARGAAVDPEAIVLTASTSEGYGLLAKLLCDPGDELLVPAPSYPLLDVLCQLECVRLVRYPLRYDGAWHADRAALAAAVTPRTRAVVVVSPANPTGAVADAGELRALQALCAERELALIGDEVFAGSAVAAAPSVASSPACLSFQLAGLSKLCGLPQLKLAWIAVAGPAGPARRALERLEVIADAYLSVAGPVQRATPELLRRREAFLAPLRDRLARNEEILARALPERAPFHLLRRAGGWSALLRIGETLDEERLCLDLLGRGVVVQPGYFYDFPSSGFLVLSLLPDPETFRRGVGVVVETLVRAR